MAEKQWPGEVGNMPPAFRKAWAKQGKKWAAFRAEWERERERLDAAQARAADKVVADRDEYNAIDREIASLKRLLSETKAKLKISLTKRAQIGKRYSADRKANRAARAAFDRNQRRYAIKDRSFSEANRRLWARYGKKI